MGPKTLKSVEPGTTGFQGAVESVEPGTPGFRGLLKSAEPGTPGFRGPSKVRNPEPGTMQRAEVQARHTYYLWYSRNHAAMRA